MIKSFQRTIICRKPNVYIFQGSAGPLLIEERLRFILSNNTAEFFHIENYYHFPHFSYFLKIQLIF